MKIICSFAMMSLLMSGQDAPPPMIDKFIPVKYVEASRVRTMVAFLLGRWSGVQADDHLHMLSVHGTAEVIASIEEALKKLDVAPLDFELTVYLISSSPQGGDQLPDALASTAKQLHGVFAYKGYQLLDSFVLRGREGQNGSAEGTIKNSTYSFQFTGASVLDGSPKIVTLHNLRLSVRMPSGARDDKGRPEYKTTGVSTDIDIRDGQKVVVGKSDVNNGESPLILVVTAKVVE